MDGAFNTSFWKQSVCGFPEGARVLLAGDRFYGTARLIEWCQKAGWDYRLRLKSNLTLQHQGGKVITREIAELMPQSIVNAQLNATGVLTNIGVLQEDGHKEPWIIAMSMSPSEYKILDYGMRWSIEAMFSDFKTRGFGITQSQIKRPDRLARLILVLAIAMYWAVSTGATEEQNVAERGEKRGFEKPRGPCAHSLKQAFALSEEPSLATQKSPSSGRFG